MIILSVVMFKHYRIDPIDSNLLLNEQSINLTSYFTNEVRKQIHLDEFMNEVRQNEKNTRIYKEVMNNHEKSMKMLSKKLRKKKILDQELSFLIFSKSADNFLGVLK